MAKKKKRNNPLDSFWASTVPLVIIPVTSLLFFVVFVYLNANYVDKVFDNTNLNKTYKIEIKNNGEKVEIIEYEKRDLNKEKNKPFTFLLLGVDSKNINFGRSDAIIFGIADPGKNKIYLLSIPRDSWVYSTAKHRNDKLTHVYTSGIDNTINTIEKMLNTPIDYYAVIDFKGFEELIDSVGGINLDISADDNFIKKLNESEKQKYLSGNKLSGKEVLNYVRYRGGPRGDFGRNDRQKIALTSLINELKNIKVSEIKSHLDIIKKHFRTNMTPYHMYQRHAQFENLNELQVEFIHVSKKAKVGREGRMSVVYLNQEELAETIKKIHSIMGLPDS